MQPLSEILLGDYQCGFRPNRSTTDQICTIRQILEKCLEFNVETHHMFIDFKAACDSVNRREMLVILRKLGYRNIEVERQLNT